MNKLYTKLLLSFSIIVTSALAEDNTYIDKNAAIYKEAKFTECYEYVENYINKNSANFNLDKKVDFRKILKPLGLHNITHYQYSSTQDGDEWLNHIFLNNGGENDGFIKLLLDTKHNDISVPKMAPAGADIALQLSLNLAHIESILPAVMSNFSNQSTILDIDKTMNAKVPMMDMSYSELFKKLDIRLNLVVDMDPSKKLPTPIGVYDSPNIVGRIDGVAWAWEKLEPLIIGMTGLPFSKAEQNGLSTYKLPAELSDKLFGYSPVIVIDSAADQIWVASSSDFLAKCRDKKNTLIHSAEYLATMKGLPEKGVSMTYLSKDFAKLIAKVMLDLQANDLINDADEITKDQLKNIAAKMSKVERGFGQVVSSNTAGILFSERSTSNIEDHLKELKNELTDVQVSDD